MHLTHDFMFYSLILFSFFLEKDKESEGEEWRAWSYGEIIVISCKGKWVQLISEKKRVLVFGTGEGEVNGRQTKLKTINWIDGTGLFLPLPVQTFLIFLPCLFFSLTSHFASFILPLCAVCTNSVKTLTISPKSKRQTTVNDWLTSTLLLSRQNHLHQVAVC